MVSCLDGLGPWIGILMGISGILGSDFVLFVYISNIGPQKSSFIATAPKSGLLDLTFDCEMETFARPLQMRLKDMIYLKDYR